MGGDELADHGETNAGASDIGTGLAAPEPVEEMAQILGGDAGAGVARSR
nr:hypothetical protein [Nonomuraea basaltis]